MLPYKRRIPRTLQDFSLTAIPWLYNVSQRKPLWDPAATPWEREDIQITPCQGYSMENVFILKRYFPKFIFYKQHFWPWEVAIHRASSILRQRPRWREFLPFVKGIWSPSTAPGATAHISEVTYGPGRRRVSLYSLCFLTNTNNICKIHSLPS